MKKIKLLRLKIIRRWEDFIRKRYISIRRGINFVKEAREIKVKKGKLKYYLTIIETYDGRKLRFNLGRHFVRDCNMQEIEVKYDG